jgi:Ca2+/Na+ antiporter
MKAIIKICLLALTLAIVFVSPATIGVVPYYGMFPLLFLLVYLFYLVSYWVSEKSVQAIRSEPYALSFFCAMVPPLGEGDLVRGRLVLDANQVVLYRRTGKGTCEPVFDIPVSELDSIGVGPVLSVRKGLVLYHGEHETKFVYGKARKRKSEIVAALGWKKVPGRPQPVDVSPDAANAPSFTELQDR